MLHKPMYALTFHSAIVIKGFVVCIHLITFSSFLNKLQIQVGEPHEFKDTKNFA